MTYKVEYHSMPDGGPLLAQPELTHTEYIKTSGHEKLRRYVESQKDKWGYSFEWKDDLVMGFRFISKQGGVKVSVYVPPLIKLL